MGFKEDEDFARYLTMGAHAAAAVTTDLEARGHHIIELERYAKANKIWSIKVKRLRLPDLMCLRCGRRFESKGKSKLALKLSHSNKPGREWWEGGMRMNDVFAFIRVAVNGTAVEVGRAVYVTREALHDAANALVAGTRKSISAGSEADVSWPSWTPSYDGTLVGMSAEGLIEVTNDRRGRRAAYRNHLKWPACHVYLAPGEQFAEGDLVASCVQSAAVDCDGDTWNWRTDLKSADLDDRFAAVKAARWLGPDSVAEDLRSIIDDPAFDWRLRLEAAASLAAHEPDVALELGVRFASPGARPEEQMEAVFALAEFDTRAATSALVAVASATAVPSEVRAAALWGLGLGAPNAHEKVVPFLADPDDLVALHAAASLPDALPDSVQKSIVAMLASRSLREVAVAAHLLARHGCSDQLLSAVRAGDSDVRSLAVLAVGDLPRADAQEFFKRVDDGTREILEVLWSKQRDWLRAPNTEGGLDVLAKQRVRL